jgi:excisionase family DNA binding protein
MEKHYTVHEVAEALGIAEQTLAGWRFRNVELPYVKVGGAVRYPASAIAAYLERNTVHVGTSEGERTE